MYLLLLFSRVGVVMSLPWLLLFTLLSLQFLSGLQSMALFAEISGAESQDNIFLGTQSHFQVWKNIWRQGSGVL